MSVFEAFEKGDLTGNIPYQRSIANERPSKVLVLYTGGTIGMVRNRQNVLAPVKGRLNEFIQKDPQTHDLFYEFKDAEPNKPTQLILPFIENLKRVSYEIYEYETLLDSSNMDSRDWIRIAKDIKKFYKLYDGFVVLHGTDTLAYTSSALSFMLENLRKPVILTGSQVPILEPVTDGKDNFICSVAIAGNFYIPEVTVFFNHGLFRGNRITKLSTSAFEAFGTYNYPAIAKVGTTFQVDYRLVLNPTTLAEFSVHEAMCNDVYLLKIFPGITATSIKALLQAPVKGVVIQTFGAGNFPMREEAELVNCFKAFADQEIIFINVTQCPAGTVCAAYESGKAFYDIGVLPGYDMTAEAAYTKLCYVLSKSEWSFAEKKKNIVRSLRGELSICSSSPYDDNDLVVAVAHQLKLSSLEQIEHLTKVLIPSLVVDAVISGNLTKLSELRNWGADFNLSNGDRRTPLHIACNYGNVEVVKFLLSNGANIHVRDGHGNVPLVEAVRNSTIAVIRLLLETGAYLSMKPKDLGEELCKSAAKGHIDILKRYTVAGADLNSTDLDGRSALHMACLHGQIEVVRFLLHKGVNKDKIDILGKRPIDYAHHRGDDNIIKYLELVVQNKSHSNT